MSMGQNVKRKFKPSFRNRGESSNSGGVSPGTISWPEKTILFLDIQFFKNFVGYDFENFTLEIKPLSDAVLNFG